MKKSFENLSKLLEPLQENEQGVLRGGFSSLQIETELSKEKNKNGCVNVNCGSGTNCSDSCG